MFWAHCCVWGGADGNLDHCGGEEPRIPTCMAQGCDYLNSHMPLFLLRQLFLPGLNDPSPSKQLLEKGVGLPVLCPFHRGTKREVEKDSDLAWASGARFQHQATPELRVHKGGSLSVLRPTVLSGF